MGKITIECDTGSISDGYHTFNELYAHRCTLFSALMICNKELSWKSMVHDDGSGYDGWFIAGMDLPSGTVSYHLPFNPFWDKLINIKTLEKAPVWDGHTSEDVITRIVNWLEI